MEELFLSANGDFDIQKKHINGYGTYVVTSGLTKNGILGKSDVQARIFDENTITIDMFGNPFFRPFKYKMVTHARVFSLKPNFSISNRQGLFLANTMRFFNKKFGYENMCTWEKIKFKKIFLPIKNSRIDLDFMESFIAEIESEYVKELQEERERRSCPRRNDS